MKKKILIILNGIFGDNPQISGGDLRPLHMMKYWHQEGYDIHILSSERIGQYYQQTIPVTRHTLSSQSGKNSKINYILRAFQSLSLPSSLSRTRFDVVYSSNDTLFDALPGWLLKIKKQAKVWVLVSHWIPDWTFWKRQNTSIFHAFLFLMSQRISLFLAMMSADHIFAVSSQTKQKLIQLGVDENNILLTTCGVDLKRIRQIRSHSQSKQYDGLFMKRLESEKGIFDVIEIWNEVVKQKTDAQLCIVGVGSITVGTLKEIIRDAGLENNIQVVGLVKDFRRKIQYFVKSKVFLHPSYQENWSMVIAESLASGTPVVAYDLEELRDVWRDKISFTPPGNTQEAAKKALAVISSSNKKIALPKKYDWKNVASLESHCFLS